MIKRSIQTRRFLIIAASLVLLVACKLKSTYNVKDGQYLLNENEIVVNGDDAFKGEMQGVIRQQPNLKPPFGPRFRLIAYNLVDSARVQKRHNKMLVRFRKRNAKRTKRANEKNEARIQHAQKEFPKQLIKNRKHNAKELNKAAKINKKRKEKLAKVYKKYQDNSKKYSEARKLRIQQRLKEYSPYIPNLRDTVAMVQVKYPKVKDTVNVKQRAFERLKYKYGEPPVIADSNAMTKSKEQLQAFLRSKGFYNVKVEAKFDTIKKKKVKGVYTVTTGERFIIDSVFLLCPNPEIKAAFLKYIRKEEDAGGLNTVFQKGITDKQSVSLPYDANKFDAYRYELATYMGDSKFYGFSEQNVFYRVDTLLAHNSGPKRMKLTIGFSERVIITEGGETREVPFTETMVKGVYFHISDTSYSLNYTERLRERSGIGVPKTGFLPTLDTFYYHSILKKVENKEAAKPKNIFGSEVNVYYKSSVHKNIFGKAKDSIGEDPVRKAYFLYNDELFTSPGLLECQNYMENENWYKEYYIDRSNTRFLQLGLFDEIKPVVLEPNPGNGFLEMHYYLVPSVRRAFSVQPRATNVNGFLGISAQLSFSDINVMKSGTKMNFSIGSGFEQNSRIIQDESKHQPFFNTIEIGPTLKFDVPGLFPFAKITKLGKRQRPRTEISTAVNYQQRLDFTRSLVQFNYIYKFAVGDGKTQQYALGVLIPVIKVVSIKKTDDFTARINQLNDLFLKNAYNNQVIWETARLNWSFDNLEKEKRLLDRTRISINLSGTLAGYGLDYGISTINNKMDADGRKLIFGIPFSQFALVDSKFIANVRYSKTKSLAFRVLAGAGKPGKNSNTSLPYDYSFSSGGANDIRAWDARQLGPGSYLSLLDPNAVATQIGDIRMESSIEFRFGSGGIINHAFFADAGNTWTYRKDPLRPGSNFGPNFYKQIALGMGYGLRLDFSFFIFRIDVAVPIYNPTLPEGSKWVYETRKAYNDRATEIYGDNFKNVLYKYQLAPFMPNVNIGIGFPF